MRIEFVDGWPFHQPRLLVEGIATEHVNAAGEVCLWPAGDPSRAWMTLAGLQARIAEWVEAAKLGFPREDAVLDAHLYFGERIHPGIATIGIEALGIQGRHGEKRRIYGRWQNDRLWLELNRQRDGAEVEGHWYYADNVPLPPHNLAALRALLARSQQRDLDQDIRAVDSGKGERVAVLIWDGEAGRNVLVVCLGQENGAAIARAIEVAPTDEEYLALRAGPDIDELRVKKVVVFGAGAIGSQAAVRLAESGVGDVVLRDSDLLRPGNVVRHAASSSAVGLPKVAAVADAIKERVPWTALDVAGATWHPDDLAAAVAAADLVVDATGNAGFADLLSLICERADVPLVSAALFRGGAVGRVRRLAHTGDTAFCARVGASRYPTIPPGEERVGLEPGCSAPVNNASPVAVAALAALTASVAIDALTGRFDYGEETIEVFRPIPEAPFDRLGRVRLDP